MKPIFRYIIFATVALSAVLAACSKDTVVESNPDTAEGNQGLRTIILQFSPDTKVAFGGTRPEFQAGDVIKVANATQSEDATIQVSDGVASITTSLTGPLTAVFPSSEANVTGSGPLGTPEYIIKDQQDGTVADALIAVAQIEGTRALFKLKSALFEITPPSGATSFIVTSLNTIDSGTGQRSTTANAVAINTTGASDAAKRVITVTGLDTGGKAYVALVPGVNLTDLSFDAGATIGLKGIPESKLGTTPNATVARGKYTIDNNNWHPYVEISGLKWATMNIGATSDTTDGIYFAWGGTFGYLSGESGLSSYYYRKDCPLTDGTFQDSHPGSFIKYVTNATYAASGYSVDNKTELELVDDAAYAYWGGAWRMPNKTEMDNLLGQPKSGSSSLLTVGTSPNQIKLHRSGYASDGSVKSGGSLWTSTMDTSDNSKGYRLDLSGGTSSITKIDPRFIGHNIRPVADL